MTDNIDSNKNGGQRKVLIIEDDFFLGGILLRHMLEKNILARLVVTGENAIEEIKKDIPDILVLDILITGANGLDILELIRKDAVIAKLPVLMVSNTIQVKDIEKIQSLGALFLLKALATPENIVEKIEEVLTTGTLKA